MRLLILFTIVSSIPLALSLPSMARPKVGNSLLGLMSFPNRHFLSLISPHILTKRLVKLGDRSGLFEDHIPQRTRGIARIEPNLDHADDFDPSIHSPSKLVEESTEKEDAVAKSPVLARANLPPSTTPKDNDPNSNWIYKKASLAAAIIVTTFAGLGLVFVLFLAVRKCRRYWTRRHRKKMGDAAFRYSVTCFSEANSSWKMTASRESLMFDANPSSAVRYLVEQEEDAVTRVFQTSSANAASTKAGDPSKRLSRSGRLPNTEHRVSTHKPVVVSSSLKHISSLKAVSVAEDTKNSSHVPEIPSSGLSPLLETPSFASDSLSPITTTLTTTTSALTNPSKDASSSLGVSPSISPLTLQPTKSPLTPVSSNGANSGVATSNVESQGEGKKRPTSLLAVAFNSSVLFGLPPIEQTPSLLDEFQEGI